MSGEVSSNEKMQNEDHGRNTAAALSDEMLASFMRVHATMVKVGLLSSHKTVTRTVADRHKFAELLQDRTIRDGVLPVWARTRAEIDARTTTGDRLNEPCVIDVSTKHVEFASSDKAVISILQAIVQAVVGPGRKATRKKIGANKGSRIKDVAYALLPKRNGSGEEMLVLRFDSRLAPKHVEKARKAFEAGRKQLMEAFKVKDINLAFGILSLIQGGRAQAGLLSGRRGTVSFTQCMSARIRVAGADRAEEGVIIAGHSLWDFADERFDTSVYEPYTSTLAEDLVARLANPHQAGYIQYDPSLDAAKHVDAAFIPLARDAGGGRASLTDSKIKILPPQEIREGEKVFLSCGKSGNQEAVITTVGAEVILLDASFGDHLYTNMIAVADSDASRSGKKKRRLTVASDSGSPVYVDRADGRYILGMIIAGPEGTPSGQRECESYALSIAVSLRTLEAEVDR